MKAGIQRAGYTVATREKVKDSKPLPLGTSARLSELTALTWALEISKGKGVNICTQIPDVLFWSSMLMQLFGKTGSS
jgi:hypothetical protein